MELKARPLLAGSAQHDGFDRAVGACLPLSLPLQPQRRIAFLGGADVERLAVGESLAFAGIDRRGRAIGGAVAGDRARSAGFDHFRGRRFYHRGGRILSRLRRLLVEVVKLGLLLLELGVEVSNGVAPPACEVVKEAGLLGCGWRRCGTGSGRLRRQTRLCRCGGGLRCRDGGRGRLARLRQRRVKTAGAEASRNQSAADALRRRRFRVVALAWYHGQPASLFRDGLCALRILSRKLGVNKLKNDALSQGE